MKKNIIANFVGRFWSVLSNFLFIPLYINILGIESYSIISFALVIHSIIAIMDAGLSATLSREFASSKNSKKHKLEIFKTLESCYFIVSSVVVLIVALSSKSIAFKWLNLELVSPEAVSFYLKIIGVEVAFRLLGRFYSGGFIGLEHQVKSNVYEIILGVVRNGLVLIPICFYPSLEVFFIWQTTATIIYVIVIRIDIYHTLYKTRASFFKSPKIDGSILKQVFKFAGGMMLIALVAGLNSQMDKLALSKLLSIETLGIYTLAFALANGLHFMSTPISTAILPRMTTFFTANKKEQAIELFSKSFALVSVFVFSFAASMCIYGEELIWVWTNNKYLAVQAGSYMTYAALGTAFLATQNLPFNVVVSNGHTKYNNILGISSLIITMPGYWILTKMYGGEGAAFTFAFVQIIISFIFLFLVNKRFLNLPYKTLYVKNYMVPVIISFSVTFALSNIIDISGVNRFATLIFIGFVVCVTLLANILVLLPLREIRQELKNIIRNN